MLPELGDEEALEVASIHSVAGLLAPGHGLPRRRPFQAPHHSATMPALIGGGAGIPRPGAASLAHCGVLLLDEAPEFQRNVLDALRQPLESGSIVISRAQASVTLPARFQLVLTANPCPCGLGSGKGLRCTCSATQKRKYFGKLSGPLLDGGRREHCRLFRHRHRTCWGCAGAGDSTTGALSVLHERTGAGILATSGAGSSAGGCRSGRLGAVEGSVDPARRRSRSSRGLDPGRSCWR